MTTHVLGLHIGVVLISFFHAVHGSQEITKFQHVPTLDNKQCDASVQSFSTKAGSRIQCGILCAAETDCESFSHSEVTDDCVGCVSFSPQTCPACTGDASGALYYSIDTTTSPSPRNCTDYQAGGNDCLTIKQNDPFSQSGMYTVTLSSNRDIEVYCDMETEGGGWTVFQYRYEGSVDFYRTYQNYTDGFGDVCGEFWLGLENIHEMAPPEIQSEVYLYLDDGDTESIVQRASVFSVGPGTCYSATIQTGDSDFTYNNGACFSAKDDGPSVSCATSRRSGWWHKGCTWINPNGLYVTPGTRVTYPTDWAGLTYYPWKSGQSLATSKIMFRRN